MDEVIEPSTTEEASLEQTQEETGLLDNATPEEEVSTEGNKEVEIDHRDPETVKQEKVEANEGEKPDWLPENFWKGDDAEADYEAMAKSWTDLRKQISQGKHKAPKDGKYDASAFGETPEDDPVRSHVMSWAKDNSISQAALDTLVSEVVGMNQNAVETYQTNLAEEKKQLGPNADARINGMVKWASSLVQKGVWGKDDFEEFKVMGGTAKGISALEKIRSSYEGRIPTQSAPVDGAPSKEELYAMVGDEKYQTDPSYRAKVEKAFSQNFS
jgi:hypothetical protein|tara:strand:- start:182 stop:994 length:813 start_codon:yes stop_codon:yes gene_type:complete